MVSLGQLLDSPALRPLLACVSRPAADRDVGHLALVEDLGDLALAAPDALVLLTNAAASDAGTERFDLALALAGERQVAALVLAERHAERITPASSAIAQAGGVALLALAGEIDLAQLAILAGRELDRGAGGADGGVLLRAHAALRAIAAQSPDSGSQALVERAGDAFGVALRIVDAEPRGGPRAAIVVADRVEGWVTAPRQRGDLALGLEIVLHAAAAGAARTIARARRAAQLQAGLREEVLSALLAAAPRGRTALVRHARALGFPIDGWHVAVRLDFEGFAETAAGADLTAYEHRLRLAHDVLQAMLVRGGMWHSARDGQAHVLLRTYDRDPGAGVASTVARAVEPALGAGGPPLNCGVGGAHEGPAGLLAAVTESKAAVTLARASGRRNAAVPFDPRGMRRALVEWYAAGSAQEAVTAVLAPLTSLGGARGERLVETLHTYLDQQGSISKTAKRLNLHRNAVSYRISQIFELLDVDPADPDDRLLLALACRARDLA